MVDAIFTPPVQLRKTVLVGLLQNAEAKVIAITASWFPWTRPAPDLPASSREKRTSAADWSMMLARADQQGDPLNASVDVQYSQAFHDWSRDVCANGPPPGTLRCPG
jgi:hypothetical protein